MDAPGSYLYIITLQWQVSRGAIAVQTFHGQIMPGPGTTRRSLMQQILDRYRREQGIREELPAILFFSLEPNDLPGKG